VHIDQLLEASVAILRVEENACLVHYGQGPSLERRESIESALRHLREILVQVLRDSGIPLPAPTCEALRAVQARVLLARIALDELGAIPAAAGPVVRELKALSETLGSEPQEVNISIESRASRRYHP
jgi:hypothetical protein